MYTNAARTLSGYFPLMRTFGAQIRRVLLDNVARHWNVPLSELTTEPSRVVHAGSRRSIAYGDVVAFLQMPRHGARNKAGGPEEARQLSLPRQGHHARRRAVQDSRRRGLRHRRAGARHGLRIGAAIAGRGRYAGHRGRCQGPRHEGRDRHRAAALWRRRRGRSPVDGLRRARCVVGDLEAHRQGLGQGQPVRSRRLHEAGTRPGRARPGGRRGDWRCGRGHGQGGNHHRRRVLLRPGVSRADGAAERGGICHRGWRRR